MNTNFKKNDDKTNLKKIDDKTKESLGEIPLILSKKQYEEQVHNIIFESNNFNEQKQILLNMTSNGNIGFSNESEIINGIFKYIKEIGEELITNNYTSEDIFTLNKYLTEGQLPNGYFEIITNKNDFTFKPIDKDIPNSEKRFYTRSLRKILYEIRRERQQKELEQAIEQDESIIDKKSYKDGSMSLNGYSLGFGGGPFIKGKDSKINYKEVIKEIGRESNLQENIIKPLNAVSQSLTEYKDRFEKGRKVMRSSMTYEKLLKSNFFQENKDEFQNMLYLNFLLFGYKGDGTNLEIYKSYGLKLFENYEQNDKGNFKENFVKLQKLLSEIKDRELVTNILNSIGNIYYQLKSKKSNISELTIYIDNLIRLVKEEPDKNGTLIEELSQLNGFNLLGNLFRLESHEDSNKENFDYYDDIFNIRLKHIYNNLHDIAQAYSKELYEQEISNETKQTNKHYYDKQINYILGESFGGIDKLIFHLNILGGIDISLLGENRELIRYMDNSKNNKNRNNLLKCIKEVGDILFKEGLNSEYKKEKYQELIKNNSEFLFYLTKDFKDFNFENIGKLEDLEIYIYKGMPEKENLKNLYNSLKVQKEIADRLLEKDEFKHLKQIKGQDIVTQLKQDFPEYLVDFVFKIKDDSKNI